ncbi:PX domain-containing protein EREX isoform X1 [Arachis duranensis]|uniref:PX domain-containing protein EREX isoform X1 n=1 Tax=Arachis duranensis TaxID=130453 RepID=A0A6P4B735_ARADU|nr:PX domain-containing protein EREX isoform X1 [Arachis duranensis]
MHPYVHDFSVLDLNFSCAYADTVINPFAYRRSLLNDDYFLPQNDAASLSPKHRHDGTSPLPLGMDWSPPPRKWDGRNSVWPHDPHTGWSFCVTVPSWVTVPQSGGSEPVVFYRVLVGIQSPEGVTSTRVILRRFSDFLKLFSDLKKEFPMKNLPPAPSRKVLRIKSHALLEERRCLLADWMEKLLSDIDVSRSVPAAMFLELEAAARSAFHDVNQHISEKTSASGATPSIMFRDSSHGSVNADNSFITSESGNDTSYEVSELGSPRHGKDKCSGRSMENSTLEHNLINSTQTHDRAASNKGFTKEDSSADKVTANTTDAIALRLDGTEFQPGTQKSKLNVHVKRLSTESIDSDFSSVQNSETSNSAANSLLQDVSHHHESCEPSRNSLVTLPLYERHKLNRVLTTQQQRLVTAKTDVEDLLARLNQEMAARQYLMTKVKDLEVELETTRLNCRENMQQAVLTEKERFTQMQWDMEELRRKCLELEMKLKSEEDERVLAESTKESVIQEKQLLQQELDAAREQLEQLQKYHDEFETKSKTDSKLLVKEVKSLRSSQLELKQQLSDLMKEKIDVERILQKERQRMELLHNANSKLLHECGILQRRLKECSVNFLVEEEDKLTVDASPSDALDLLATSDNRIGLLLAEAQLLAQDVENAGVALDESRDTANSGATGTTPPHDELRKMLADVFVDNASLRKQINSVIRCALNSNIKSGEGEEGEEEEEVHLQKTVLSKFLER